MPKLSSGAGYRAHEYIFPLILMLNGGGRRLEDIWQKKGVRPLQPENGGSDGASYNQWNVS